MKIWCLYPPAGKITDVKTRDVHLNMKSQGLAAPVLQDTRAQWFVVSTAVLLLCSGLIAGIAESYHSLFTVINEFILIFCGIYFVTFFGIWFAISFLVAQLLTVSVILGWDGLTVSAVNHLVSYITTPILLIFIELAIKKKHLISWPQVAAIGTSAMPLFHALVSKNITGAGAAQEFVALYIFFPIDIVGFSLVYLLYNTVPTTKRMTWRRERVGCSLFSHVTVGSVVAPVLVFSAMSLLVMRGEVDVVIDAVEKRLKVESVGVSESLGQFFMKTGGFVILNSQIFSDSTKKDYSDRDREILSYIAPSILEVRIGSSLESSRFIYKRGGGSHETLTLDSEAKALPCSGPSYLSCTANFGLKGYYYKIQLNDSENMFFLGDYDSMDVSFSDPFILAFDSPRTFTLPMAGADKLDTTHYYDAKTIRVRDMTGNDLHMRSWLILANIFPDFGMRMSIRSKRDHGDIVLFASMKSELAKIQSLAVKIAQVFIVIFLLLQIVLILSIAQLSKQIAVQLRKIEQWFLRPDYKLDVDASRITELNDLFIRIRSAAYAQRAQISEKMELGRLLLLEHRQVAEMFDTSEDFALLLLAENGDVVIANKASKELMYIESGMNINANRRDIQDARSDLLLDKVSKQYDQLKKNTPLKKLEGEFFVKDESERSSNWLISASIYRSVNAETGNYLNRCLVWIRNIDELVTARSQAEHADRLSLLGETVAGMAHEINQPLNVIALAAENCEILLSAEAPDKDKLRQKLKRIKKQVNRASTLITRIKGHGTAIDEGQTVFEVNDAIASVFDMLSPQLELDDISLETALYKDDVLANGSKTKLEQIISNVIINARDAIVSNDNRQKSEAIHLVLSGGEKTLLVISNDGETIPDAVLKKMFDPFYSTKVRSDSSGMGLGLSISARLINELGGDIRVESRQEKTSFYIILPHCVGERAGAPE